MSTFRHPHAPSPPLQLQRIMSITFDGAGAEFVVMAKNPELEFFHPHSVSER